MLEAIKLYFLPCFINAITVVYLSKKILNISLDIKKIKFYIIILITTLVFIFNYIYVDKSVRFINSTIMTVIFLYFLFNTDLNNIIIATIFEQIIMFISEIIFSLIVLLISQSTSFLFELDYGILISNLSICLISILFINMKPVYLGIVNIINIMNKIINYNKYIIALIFISSINFLLFLLYMNYDNGFTIFLSVLLILFYTFVVYMLLIERNKNYIYLEKNKLLISNLNEYEKMLDYQRVNNHENKNQLLVIKSMIEKKDKNTIDYINEIIKDKREDNDILYTKTKRIPSGGLQGLIYQKMLLIQEKGINIVLDVSTKVRKVDLLNISPKMNYDICRIVGIILDNAIEETEKINKKDKEILISMYIDDYFNIEISNHFVGDIEIDKIFNKGYTTKGNGHGYGLSLLKQIVSENKNIINETKIINNVFTQIIKIKM